MAQAPQSFEYQAVVRDASGNILTNQELVYKLPYCKEVRLELMSIKKHLAQPQMIMD